MTTDAFASPDSMDTVAVRPTVLLVEDEDAVRRLVGTMLSMSGFDVLPVGTAAEALETGRSFTGRIHAVLADISLPDLPGDELARQLRGLRPEMGVLLTSGLPDGSDGQVIPADVFLQKPFTRAVLVERLRGVMAAP
jgi:DNA-binding response OmpR family regulator